MDNMTQISFNTLKKIIELGKCKMTVYGTSMEPTFYAGQCVHILPIDTTAHVNDIVLTEADGRRITHRVIATDEHYTLTKGDNNPYIDKIVPNDNVLGIIEEQFQKRYKKSPYSIQYNFWRKDAYESCKDVGERLKLDMIQKANYIPKDKLNIAVSPYAVKKIANIGQDFEIDKDICIHIGVNIGNVPAEGIIMDSEFDGVYSGGSLWSPHKLNDVENFLVLYGQVSAFASEVVEIDE